MHCMSTACCAVVDVLFLMMVVAVMVFVVRCGARFAALCVLLLLTRPS
jgi:hypothetical protein